MKAIDTISHDLDWREREIASMRILITGDGLTQSQRKALLRAAWAMLYAHYEGFIKNTLTVFYDEAAKATEKCENLPSETRAFALKDALKNLRNLKYGEMLSSIEQFHIEYLTSPPVFPTVDTDSNLWPHTLVKLLNVADLSTQTVEKHAPMLRTLVSRRNSIAHGEKTFINDLPYYLEFEAAVYEVLYDVALQVDTRLSQPPYIN